jgi:hypothetical protein
MNCKERNSVTVACLLMREPVATPICREFRGGGYTMQTKHIWVDKQARQRTKPNLDRTVRALAVGTYSDHKTYFHGGSPRC